MDSENQIFQLIKTGDKSAFETLFKAHYSHLCAYAKTFLIDLDAAQDLVQEFLFQLWQKREELPVDVHPAAYLFKSIQNRCLNVLKHRKIQDKHRDFTINSVREHENTELEQETNELHEKIRQTIDKLPPERRKVFVMHRYEEMKYREIAEKLNISIKTVENQIGKALSFLRDELKDYLPLLFLFIFKIFKKIF